MKNETQWGCCLIYPSYWHSNIFCFAEKVLHLESPWWPCWTGAPLFSLWTSYNIAQIFYLLYFNMSISISVMRLQSPDYLQAVFLQLILKSRGLEVHETLYTHPRSSPFKGKPNCDPAWSPLLNCYIRMGMVVCIRKFKKWKQYLRTRLAMLRIADMWDDLLRKTKTTT